MAPPSLAGGHGPPADDAEAETVAETAEASLVSALAIANRTKYYPPVWLANLHQLRQKVDCTILWLTSSE